MPFYDFYFIICVGVIICDYCFEVNFYFLSDGEPSRIQIHWGSWGSRSEGSACAVSRSRGENLSQCMFVCDKLLTFFCVWQFCLFVFQYACLDEELPREELQLLVKVVVSRALSLIHRRVARSNAAEAMVASLEEELSKARQELRETGRSQEESEDKGKMQLFMCYGPYLIWLTAPR